MPHQEDVKTEDAITIEMDLCITCDRLQKKNLYDPFQPGNPMILLC